MNAIAITQGSTVKVLNDSNSHLRVKGLIGEVVGTGGDNNELLGVKLSGITDVMYFDSTELEPAPTMTVGERIALPKFSMYRSLYPVYENGDLLAFIGVKNGWGQSWRTYRLKFAPNGANLQFEGMQPDDTYASSHTKKDFAVEYVTSFREKFKTRTVMQAEAAAARAELLKHAEEYLNLILLSHELSGRQVAALDAVLEVTKTGDVEALIQLRAKVHAEHIHTGTQIVRQRAAVAEYRAAL